MLQETGEHVIMGAGELHLERCLKDLRERFAKIAIHVSPPIVPFRESIVTGGKHLCILGHSHLTLFIKTSKFIPAILLSFIIIIYLDLSANKEKDGVTVPRGTLTVPIPSKYLSLKIRAVPLPKNVMELLASHTATIKHIVEQKIARKIAQKQNKDVEIEEIKADNITGELSEEKILSASEFQDMLKKEFQIAQSQGGPLASLWDGIVDQCVLCFIIVIACRYTLHRLTCASPPFFFLLGYGHLDLSESDQTFLLIAFPAMLESTFSMSTVRSHKSNLTERKTSLWMTKLSMLFNRMNDSAFWMWTSTFILLSSFRPSPVLFAPNLCSVFAIL
jgi:hypothetical protein